MTAMLFGRCSECDQWAEAQVDGVLFCAAHFVESRAVVVAPSSPAVDDAAGADGGASRAARAMTSSPPLVATVPNFPWPRAALPTP